MTLISHQAVGNRRSLIIAILFAAAVASATRGHAANWLGGNGNWDDPSRWSAGTVPDNSDGSRSIDVVIDGDPATHSNVLLSGRTRSSTSVSDLTIDAGDRLSIGEFDDYGPETQLQVSGDLTVDGTLRIDLNTRNPVMLSLVGNAAISGRGTVEAFYDVNAGSGDYMTAIRSTGSLLIRKDLTLRAGGYRGAFFESWIGTFIATSNGPLVNEGRIVVDHGFVSLFATEYTNTGTIELAPATYLTLWNTVDLRRLGQFRHEAGTVVIKGRLENSGQTLLLGAPGDAGGWILDGGTIAGGTLAGGAGTLVTSSIATLDSVRLADNATVQIFGRLSIKNGVTGEGTFSIHEPGFGDNGLDVGDRVPSGIRIVGGTRDDIFEQRPTSGRVTFSRNEGTVRAESASALPATLHIVAPFGVPGPTQMVNAGRFELTPRSTLLADALRLSFAPGSVLCIEGGGLLQVGGTLDLTGEGDRLIVQAKVGGAAYDDEQIVRCWTLVGTFDSVTPGISVRYTDGAIYISGTPTPEPGLAVGLSAALILMSRRRHPGR